MSRRVRKNKLLKMLRSPRKPVTSCRFEMVVASSAKAVAMEMKKSGLGQRKLRDGVVGLSHRLDVRERKITGDIQMSGLGALLDVDYEVIAESEGPVGQAVATFVKELDM